MTSPLYVLTDADGYTSACPADAHSLLREVSRLPMRAPILVAHFITTLRIRTVEDLGPIYPVWAKVREWLYNGN